MPLARRKSRAALRPVDLEPMVPAPVVRGEPEVVEHGPDVEQLVIDLQPSMAAAERPEEEDPERVGEQQGRAVLPKQVGRLAGELAVGDPNASDDFRHERPPFQ